MNNQEQNRIFKTIKESYDFSEDKIILGGLVLDNQVFDNAKISIPLKTLNRHGLISGATGTGKTKTLQVITEQLSEKGISSLVMDIKGDLSGIAKKSIGHPKIDERMNSIGLEFKPTSYPVELLSISDDYGARLRTTVSELGPLLLTQMLNLSSAQSGILSVLFKYADDNNLALVDLNDIKSLLVYATGEGNKEIEELYGNISTTSANTIIRKIVDQEREGLNKILGEPSFDVHDLLKTTYDKKGIVNIMRLTDIQGTPKLFSSFMLGLLTEVYNAFPEEGDIKKPKLMIFIEEAHLFFDNASDSLIHKVEMIVKLIRSKGVGVVFVTQNPIEIPEIILSQLGFKIQHALRAFTAKDRKSIRLASQNFPESEAYDIDQLITQLGIGEALITVLNTKGIPTKVAYTMLRAPQSRMDILTNEELEELINSSRLYSKYNSIIDEQTAHEILQKKIVDIKQRREEEKQLIKKTKLNKKKNKRIKPVHEKLANNIKNTLIRKISNSIVNAILKSLKIK